MWHPKQIVSAPVNFSMRNKAKYSNLMQTDAYASCYSKSTITKNIKIDHKKMPGFLNSRFFKVYIVPGAVFQSVMVGGGYGNWP